jgi:hypothetical protein
MIGQYLPNNNEKSYSAILQNFLHLNRPLVLVALRASVGFDSNGLLELHSYIPILGQSSSTTQPMYSLITQT